MATCDRGHEPITFDSPFTSMCPLCNLINERQERALQNERAMQEHLDEQESELESLRSQLDSVSYEYAVYRKEHPEAK